MKIMRSSSEEHKQIKQLIAVLANISRPQSTPTHSFVHEDCDMEVGVRFPPHSHQLQRPSSSSVRSLPAECLAVASFFVVQVVLILTAKLLCSLESFI